MQEMHLVLHGLAIKKHGSAGSVASLTGLDAQRVDQLLRDGIGRGKVVEVQGRYMLAPLARVSLDAEYSRYYHALRADAAFVAAYEEFEVVNLQLKALITAWQSMEVAGQVVTNDHSDADYDRRIIDKLGDLHERADGVLARLERSLPRLGYYRRKLLEALERSEDGAHEWVSDVKIDSYHTVWFELHEDLLRILGRTRVD
jgi:hypothetical protein